LSDGDVLPVRERRGDVSINNFLIFPLSFSIFDWVRVIVGNGSWSFLFHVVVCVRKEKEEGVCFPDFVSQEVKE
jgi:hypothetical protein